MVILGYKTGQLGNRLFSSAHWLANSWKYGYALYNPAFDEYGIYFANGHDGIYEEKKSWLSLWFVRHLVLLLSKVVFKVMSLQDIEIVGNRLLRFYRLPENDKSMDLRNEEFVRLRERTQCLIVQGWLYRDELSFREYAQRIRECFRLIPEHETNIKRLMEQVRGAGIHLIVGLHIRRGDYKDFLGGEYYYTNEQYCEVMRKVEEHFHGKKVRWLICSNELVAEEAFSAFDVVLGNGQIVEDMYAFANCDYIVGPPSTYTGWASFYGDKKLYFIRNTADEITFEKIV